MSISTFQYQEMLRRVCPRTAQPSKFEPCEKEVGAGGLHEAIEAECRHRLWPYIHSRTDKRSTTGIGSVDFVIAADRGRTFYVELKSKSGKQTTEQKGFQMMLERNGHKYFLVRSFEQFLEIVK